MDTTRLKPLRRISLEYQTSSQFAKDVQSLSRSRQRGELSVTFKNTELRRYVNKDAMSTFGVKEIISKIESMKSQILKEHEINN